MPYNFPAGQINYPKKYVWLKFQVCSTNSILIALLDFNVYHSYNKGPEYAQEKLKFCKAVKGFDFVTNHEDGLKAANDELNDKGIKVFEINGDVTCNAVMCLVNDKVLLQCDVGKEKSS